MNKIIHGLNLPNEIADKNIEVFKKQLGIEDDENES